ncbi:uncharacterized protein LOC135395736, partial [Ornithodoros turicata]|uniref:uncharacterized protein LOC135395736 n=1 Tax=Ornithodoros turicata TaxID=34597 RepID=UPI0031391B5F
LADGSVRQYLTCHRSGKYYSTGTGKRMLKSQKSWKLAEGVSLEAVLDDTRDSTTGPVSRLHLVTRMNLHNILKSFDINYAEKMNHNDFVSVATWVDAMLAQENGPVKFFKQQGVCDEKGLFNKEDFVLVIMTEPQQQLLSKLGSEKICIDSTHGTTGYDFNLTTLMTVDEYGAGVPCAYLLSNRTDTATLKVFLESVRACAGPLNTTVFMSDDASEFYNAWRTVMGQAEWRLLCAWHMDQNWRKNLSKIKGQNTQIQVYKTLRLLLECTDAQEFEKLMTIFE